MSGKVRAIQVLNPPNDSKVDWEFFVKPGEVVEQAYDILLHCFTARALLTNSDPKKLK